MIAAAATTAASPTTSADQTRCAVHPGIRGGIPVTIASGTLLRTANTTVIIAGGPAIAIATASRP